MKSHEKEVIKHMRNGKKQNISEIARNLNLPITTVSDRIKRIEERYILKYSSILDYEKIGLSASILAIKVEQKQKVDFIEFLKKQECINSIYHTNSDFDVLVEIIFKNNVELYNWIENTGTRFSLEIKLFQILKIVEKEKFVP